MAIAELSKVERRWFIRHFLEMVAAMAVGMVVLGALVRAFCALVGHEGLLDHPGASAPIMATNMTVGMALWMWHRGHGWGAIGEMAAAMYAPLIVLLTPFWVGMLSGGALLGGTHLLMLPAMWLAMLHRRAEYARGHLPLGSARPLAQVRAIQVLGSSRREDCDGMTQEAQTGRVRPA